MAIELKKIVLEDLDRKSQAFDNEIDGHGKLSLVDMYGVLFPNGTDKKPIWFTRHSNPDSYRFGGIFEPGDDYLSVQKPLHMEDLAQKETLVDGYKKVSKDAYGIGSKHPFSEYRFYEDHATYKEADAFDLDVEYFPYAIYKHADHSTFLSQITQCSLFSGTYEGKPVRGIGNFELMFVPQKEQRELNDYAAYIYSNCTGVREDGRKEIAMIYMNLNGQATGFYWLEGEEPIFSEEVKMEAEWVRLPYMKDHTCIYKDAIWHFGGKEIHFIGQWGYKGLTAYPRIELGGQSQVLGTWYEGKKPYKHDVYMTFNENMQVIDKNLEKMGFKVR